jgi:steroid delta-isomerase-like uncharacterized protein
MARDIEKMMEDYLLAINSHDVNKILSFWADDCVLEAVGLGAVYRGKKELTSYVNSLLNDSPDLKEEAKSVFGTDDWACVEYVFSGTHKHSSMPGIPATGKTFSFRGVEIYQLRNGKFNRASDYPNVIGFMQQVGLMPGQPK